MDGAPEPERDWFGNPLRPRPDPVPCPSCGEAYTDPGALAAHLADAHGVSTTRGARRRGPRRPDAGGRAVGGPAAGGPGALRRDLPALGRNRRSPLARRLRTTPLVLVVTANVALVLVSLAALGALSPDWWTALQGEAWGRFVVVPMMWPTVLFLFVRGFD